MTHSTRLLSLIVVLCLPACGDDDAPTDAAVPDAPQGPDAAPPDAGAPDADPSPLGTWRVVSLVSGADTILTTDTDVGGGELVRVNGLLQLAASEGSFSLAEVRNGRLSSQVGNVDTLGFSGDFTSLMLTHSPPVAMSFDAAAGTLALELDPTNTLNFVRHAHASSETLTVTGQVRVEDDGVPGNMLPIVTPRAAVVHLLRGVGGTEFIALPADDVALPAFGASEAQTATFDLSRLEGALGVQRITFGTTGFLAVALIVVYDDIDLDSQLGDLFGGCASPTSDCVRGVSPIVLGYRVGNSPELADSPYHYLKSGWTWSVVAPDYRLGDPPRVGLVSLDPTTTSVPVDVVVTEDPTTMPASIPALTFPP